MSNENIRSLENTFFAGAFEKLESGEHVLFEDNDWMTSGGDSVLSDVRLT